MASSVKEKREKFIYESKWLSFAVVLLGIVCISVPDTVARLLPWFLGAYVALEAAVNVFRSVGATDKKVKVVCLFIAAVNIAIGCLFVVFKERADDMVALLMALAAFVDAFKCTFEILSEKPARRIVIKNIFMAVIHIVLGAELIRELGEAVSGHVVLYGFLFLVKGIFALIKQLGERVGKNKLRKILVGTYAAEILMGLFLAMTVASVIFPLVEPSIKDFGDGLWYSFALVTTIGFGDIAAQTAIGRLLSVFIGGYGIVVVALITSIIVNFYNERQKASEADSERANGVSASASDNAEGVGGKTSDARR